MLGPVHDSEIHLKGGHASREDRVQGEHAPRGDRVQRGHASREDRAQGGHAQGEDRFSRRACRKDDRVRGGHSSVTRHQIDDPVSQSDPRNQHQGTSNQYVRTNVMSPN